MTLCHAHTREKNCFTAVFVKKKFVENVVYICAIRANLRVQNVNSRQYVLCAKKCLRTQQMYVVVIIATGSFAQTAKKSQITYLSTVRHVVQIGAATQDTMRDPVSKSKDLVQIAVGNSFRGAITLSL